MPALTTLFCFLAGFIFCQGKPIAPIGRDLAHPPLTASHSTSAITTVGTSTSYSAVTIRHSWRSHRDPSLTRSTKSNPASIYDSSTFVNSALVTLQVTTVTTTRTVHVPYSTRSTHRSHKASSFHKSHSVHSTHRSHTTHPHQTGSPIQTIHVTQTVTYQPSSRSNAKPSITTTKDGVTTSSDTSFARVSYSVCSLHVSSPSHSSSSTSKLATPTYTISPVLSPSSQTSPSRSTHYLTSTTHQASTTKVIKTSTSSSDVTTHLTSTVHITSVITVVPSSVHSASTLTTAHPSHPIALVRAEGISSSFKAKAKDVVRAVSVVVFAGLAAGLAGVI